MKKEEFVEVNKDQEFRITLIRLAFGSLYDLVEQKCKSSRETSLGLTKLEEAQFWLIKGISREDTKEE